METENAALRRRIQELEAELSVLRAVPPSINDVTKECEEREVEVDVENKLPLTLEEYKRYGRQMIMPEIGLQGQLRLKKSKVLIIGCGGLGCPAAAYLAGAGIGTIGLIDHDIVESSNLHRQILHATSRIGISKVESAIHYLRDLNPHPKYVPHIEALTSVNALGVMGMYDLVLDCTDHPSLRYLISDAAVILGMPVVSASALRTDGQLIVLNDPPGQGPCYRCIWPRPPPPETVVGCGEGGVLGPVVGVMGVLQALEGIKLLSRPSGVVGAAAVAPTMVVFSAVPQVQFRTVRMRGRRAKCVACGEPGEEEKITRKAMVEGRVDHVAFCGGRGAVGVLSGEERVGVGEYKKILEEGRRHVLVDVRDETQFGICSLEGSSNIPYSEFEALALTEDATSKVPPALQPLLDGEKSETGEQVPVYVLCRLGNDSQLVTRQLKDAGVAGGNVFDIKGGIAEWARSGIAGPFPEY